MKLVNYLAALAVAGTGFSVSASIPETFPSEGYIDSDGTVYQFVGDNLITNGDFTNPDNNENPLIGWTYKGDVQMPAGTLTINVGDAPDGTNSVTLVNAGSDATTTIQRNIQLEAGETYYLSVSYYNLSTSNNIAYNKIGLISSTTEDLAAADAIIGGTGSKAFVPAKTDYWRTHYAIFTVPDSKTILHIRQAWPNSGKVACYQLYKLTTDVSYPEMTEQETPFEITYPKITNHSFETDLSGWKYTNMWRASNSNDAQVGYGYAESWAKNGLTSGPYYIKQTVNLDRGKYKLTARASDQDLNATNSDDVFVFAGDQQTRVSSRNTYEVVFNVLQDATDVEIGFKTDGTPAQWISVDNFRLFYLGEAEDPAAQWNSKKAEAQALLDNSDYANVTGSERAAIEALISAESVENDDYDAAIAEIATAMDTFKVAKSSYDAYASYKVNAEEVAAGLEDKYSLATEAKKEALTTLLEAPTTAAEAATNAPLLDTAYRQVIESNAVAEGVEGVVSKELGSWTDNQIDSYSLRTIYTNSGQGFTKGDGTVVSSYNDAWQSGVWANDYNQSITLPAGKYRFSVFARGTNGMFDTYKLYANDESEDLSSVGASGRLYGAGWDLTYVDFEIAKSKDVTLGIKIITTGEAWVSFTGFQLVRVSDGPEISVSYSVNVKDEDGNAVEGATVTLSNEEVATTDAEGVASFTISSKEIEGMQATVEADKHFTKSVALAWDGAEEASVDVTLPSYYSNLMEGSLNGTLGSKPAGWVSYTRAGGEGEFSVIATLRNAEGQSSSTTDTNVAFWLTRWDRIYDVYFTYAVEIPETGVYDFSMDAAYWGNYDANANQASHLPNLQGLRLTFSETLGYDYSESQSVIYEMSEAKSFANKTAKFFAKKGTYYVSFNGSHSMVAVKNLSLKRDRDVEMESQPASAELDFSANITDKEGAYVGTQIVKASEDANMEYAFVTESNGYQTYASLSDALHLGENGTLYAYEVVDGIHGVANKYDIVYTEATEENVAEALEELFNEGELFASEDMKFKDGILVYDTKENQATLIFTLPEETNLYYHFTQISLGLGGDNSNVVEGDVSNNEMSVESLSVRAKNEAASTIEIDGVEYTLYTEEGITLTQEGQLSYVLEKDGVKSSVKKLDIASYETGVKNIVIDGTENAEFYNLNGMKVSADRLAPGIYVVRNGNKTYKVIVK